MKLIGSKPSPYVRRIRLFLEGVNYDFVELDILGAEGRDELRRHTPAMKIPVLIDADHSVYDSRVIYNYLNDRLKREHLTWEQQNTLTLIDAVNDSLVTLLMLERSEIDTDGDVLIVNLQRERIAETLALLEQKVVDGEFDQWQYPAMCLYCLLDWATFRNLQDFSAYPNLIAFHQQQSSRPVVQSTDPRA